MIDTSTIAVQLYSVRDELQHDFAGTLRRIAAFGYSAVELFDGSYGESPEATRALLDELGLQVSSAHAQLREPAQKNAVLDRLHTVGCTRFVWPWLDPDTYFRDLDGVKRACELLNETYATIAPDGFSLSYHNHWFELNEIEGQPALHYMLDWLDDAITLEVDTYWVKVGGADPVQLLQQLGDRVPLLHIKDGPATDPAAAMTAAGSGVMDIPALLQASHAVWHIAELDRCDSDMMQAIADSYTYLEGLANA